MIVLAPRRYRLGASQGMEETIYDKIRQSSVPIPVTEDLYYYSLEVLPPIYGRGFFAVGEPVSHTSEGVTYFCFCESQGQYYGFYGTIEQAQRAFNQLKQAA